MKKEVKYIYKKFITPIISIRPRAILNYFAYFSDLRKYKKVSSDISIKLWPILGENTKNTNIDHHYFYQAVWAAKKIAQVKPVSHVDVGSQALYVGMLTAITNIQFVDIRPLDAKVENLTNQKGDILNLPFKDNEISSLSCLHVAEHVGLGRYGDQIDPDGTKKACRELSRVLGKNGLLYFSLPIGQERVEFNAHSIHNPKTILSYFSDLNLIEFSAVDDRGNFIENADINCFDNSKYSCGLFLLTKE